MRKKLFGWLVLCLFSTACLAQMPNVETRSLNVAGLEKTVTIKRDGRGIPYIEAQTDADLYFAQGFATAQDRLWQMDLLRRVARGESAEIFGKATLEEDKRWRKYGFSRIAEESLPFLAPDLKMALENYSRGVNAYISTLDDKTLPPEFQILQYKPTLWKPTDTIVLGKILAEALSSTWEDDLLRALLTEIPKEKFSDIFDRESPFEVILFAKDGKTRKRAGRQTHRNFFVDSDLLAQAKKDADLREISLSRIGLFAEESAASNNWVISGKRTADGKPILANDPHLRPGAPVIWYLSHLSSPTHRVSGVTFPGVPGIVLGHNEFIAWGATNVGPDVQDLYLETFDTNGKYKTPKGWELPTIRKEEIKFRPNPLSPATQTEILEVTETRNGVIFVEQGNKKFALKWTARNPANQELEAFIRLNTAKNWNDFRAALKTYGGATQNFVYADVAGNIGWYAAGKIPLRKTGDGAIPYNGATDDGEWTGHIPFEELPHLYNPKENFIVTANQRTVGKSYKYPQFARDFDAPFRARRIYDEIEKRPKITLDEVSAIQFDVMNIPLMNLTKAILKENAASPETLETLKNWDFKMSPDSKGALLASEIYTVLATKIKTANLIGKDGKPLNVPNSFVQSKILDWIVREQPANWKPQSFPTYSELFRACDMEARANLVKKYGTDEAKLVWGSSVKSSFPHPLANAPLIGTQFATPNVPMHGSSQTPNVASAVSMRFIASPPNWDLTRHIIPLGQSGNPKSPFYKDQFDSFIKGETLVFPFSKTAVNKATKEVTILNSSK